jgi:hypothetical protein
MKTTAACSENLAKTRAWKPSNGGVCLSQKWEHSAAAINFEVTPATEPDCAAFLRALEISRPRSTCSRLPARGSPPMFPME